MLRRVTHPGQILADELAEVGISAAEFARQIDVPANRISQLISGKRSVTSDTALRLAHWFGTSPQFWLNLQTQFDLIQAEDAVGEMIRVLPNRSSYELKT
ncbi:MAG: HigA family addiction module antitoxin [Pseudomonadota bacterium]